MFNHSAAARATLPLLFPELLITLDYIIILKNVFAVICPLALGTTGIGLMLGNSPSVTLTCFDTLSIMITTFIGLS